MTEENKIKTKEIKILRLNIGEWPINVHIQKEIVNQKRTNYSTFVDIKETSELQGERWRQARGTSKVDLCAGYCVEVDGEKGPHYIVGQIDRRPSVYFEIPLYVCHSKKTAEKTCLDKLISDTKSSIQPTLEELNRIVDNKLYVMDR